MLRNRRGVADACAIGTLLSSGSGAPRMLRGPCLSGHSQTPPPHQDPSLRSSATAGHRASTFLPVNHSRESPYTGETHSAVGHT